MPSGRDIELVVRLAVESDSDLSLIAEVQYTRVVQIADDQAKLVQEAQQFEAMLPGPSSIHLEDVASDSRVRVILFSGDRAINIEREVELTRDGHKLEIELSGEEANTLGHARPAPPANPILLPKPAQFVTIQSTHPDFEHSTLNVASRTRDDWQQLGLAGLFKVEAPTTTSLEWLGTGWEEFQQVAWTPVHLGVDGRFTPTFPENAGEGWLWWLSGPQSAIGSVVENLSIRRAQTLSIALPPFSAPPITVNGSHVDGRPVRPVFTESELAENPHVYTEDPGSFCRPFSNPERILSERPFYTLFRVGQPVIGAEAAVNLSDPVSFDDPLLAAAVASQLEDGPTSIFNRGRSEEGIFNRGRSEEGSSTSVLHARFGMPDLSDLEERIRNAIANFDRGRSILDAAHPVQWEGDSLRYQATTVALGHILEYRVRWRSNGYSLGTVIKTLSLAPRQIRRIEKIDWARTERTRRIERTQFSEEVSDEMKRERSYDDTVSSSLSEWSRGESRSKSGGAAGGLGFAGGGFVIGGGGVQASASSSSSQSGGRTVTASEEQNLRDSIRRFGDSLRRFESVVVNEVQQEESVTGTVEIIRNPNYGHSLTVIYYQILRHLRVDTEFAGVRECLFVPFAIKPFTLQRIYRWREALGRMLLDRQYLFPLRYIRDVMTNFAGSSIPAGRRSDQRIRHIHGSIFLRLAIERPADGPEEAFNPTTWGVLSPFLSSSALAIHARLRTLALEHRDRNFQSQEAPGIAARWVNTLQLQVQDGSKVLPADFTLVTSYRFNNIVRVDFSIPIEVGQVVTREDLASIRVKALNNLPEKSVANVKRLTLNYQTDHFNQSLSVDQGENDLVDPISGVSEGDASLSAPPTTWERQNLRVEILRGIQNLLLHLNEHLEYYHKVIWWQMDRDRLYMMLDGFYVPGTSSISIASVVEREPIAIVGNALVFRVSSGSFLGWGSFKTPEALHNYYWDNQIPRDPLYVSLPTDGLYAQTIMDQCLALEEHRGDIDWVLDEKEPELGDIDPSLLGSRRAEPAAVTPSQMPSTLISLQNAPPAPEPSGFESILNAVTNAGAFRDMAGLAGTQANVKAAMETAASLATDFGSKAVDLAKAKQGTAAANQKLASIEKAKDKGLIDNQQASARASDVLREMNMNAASKPLTQEQGVASLIESATANPDRPVEIHRGTDKFSIGAAARPGSEPSPAPTFTSAPGTNSGSSQADAVTLVDAFGTRTSSLAFKVDRAAVANRLNQLIENPDLLDQGDVNVCGPAAVFRTILHRDPVVCARLVIDLVENGRGRFFGDWIEPRVELRNQTYDPAWGIPEADWVVLSAMRDDENALTAFEGSPDESVSAMTLPGEIEDWLKATNLYRDIADETNLFFTKSTDHALELIFDGDVYQRDLGRTDNILLIHAHLLLEASATNKKSDDFILNAFPNHWVVLTSPVEKTNDGRIRLSVWTWGNARYQIDAPEATFSANYYGAIVARCP